MSKHKPIDIAEFRVQGGRKIDLADAIFVVDPGGYIGESTTREIEYARSAGKPVVRLSQIDDGGADPREF